MSPRQSNPARDYHELSKLLPGDGQARSIDPAIIPRPYKLYHGLPKVRLPVPSGPEAFSLGPRKLGDIATLLHYSAGILRRTEREGRTIEFRAASSTGAAYHINTYLICGDIDGLEAGVYHYDTHDESVDLLRKGDFRSAIREACCGNEAERQADAWMVFTSTFWCNAWRYQERAYRHAFWDSGTIIANLLELAGARSDRTSIHAAFVDDQVNRLIGVDAVQEAAVAVVAIGEAPRALSPSLPVEDIQPQQIPASPVVIEYPAIQDMHASSALLNCDEVSRFVPYNRGSIAISVGGDAVELIERRRSTREFAPAGLRLNELQKLLADVSQELPLDFEAVCEIGLVVNQVTGLAPGAYTYDPASRALRLGLVQDLREQAASLALGQAAASSAGINIYFLCDLDTVLTSLGNRGYRAAQLEGGIRGGLAYLSATSLGLRVTGLTFVDEAVTSLFEPVLGRREVLFMAAVGR